MSMAKHSLILCLAAVLTPAALAQSPQLGVPVDTQQLATLDLTVLPDGTGLPEGRGDARAGAALYQKHCLACHGARGVNGINDRLAGGQGSLQTSQPVKTVGSFWPYATTVFDFIRRAMPYATPGSLTADEVYALTAYVLFINGVIAEDDPLDARTLPAVVMPNRDNFRWSYTP